MAIGGEDTAVFCQRSTMRKIERLAIEISDPSARFLHDDRPGGLIPNSLSIIGPRTGNQSEQNVAFTGCEHRVFRLAIHSDRRGGHAEVGGELADFVDVRVRLL